MMMKERDKKLKMMMMMQGKKEEQVVNLFDVSKLFLPVVSMLSTKRNQVLLQINR